MYKTVIIGYSPRAKEMAARIAAAANRMEQEGFALISCCVAPSARGILVFRKEKAAGQSFSL